MNLWLAKVSRGSKVGLIATDGGGEAYLKTLQDGECIEVDISKPRSVQWNRLYWSLCTIIGENQDPERDKDSIDAEIRIRSGHYDVLMVDDKLVMVPKRLAFDRMDSEQWEKYWDKAIVAISERFGQEFVDEFCKF